MVRMKEFCGSEIWDTTLLWESPSPDFTPCFEKSILISVPCLYLWVFGPLEGLRLKNSKNSFIPWTWKNASKTIISAIIIAAEISLLISNIALRNDEENFLYGVDYFYPSILLVTVVLQLLFVILEKRRGLQSSGYLFGFWLLMMIFALPGYRTNFLYMQDQTKENPNGINTSGMVEFVIYMIFYPSTVVMFLLNCFADDKPQKEFYPRGTNFSPKLNASFLSEITFSWLDRLIWKGFRNPLKQEDLCDLPPENSSKVVIKHFEKHWDNVQKKFQRRKMNEKNEKKKISIFPALFNTFRYEILIGVFLKLIPDVLIFVSPLLVSLLIGFAEDLSIVEWKGYFYAIMLLIVTEVQSILNAQQFVVMTVTGLKIRTAVTSAIYKKALRISSSAKKESTVGEIVNLMAVDIQRFMDMMGYVNAMWSAPLQIILCIFFLWRILGPSAMVGLLIMIIFIPLNGWIASKQKGFQITQMKEKDKRVKIMNEILNGIKVLKLYAWEPAFISQVKDIRKTEVNVLKKSSYLGAGTSFLFTCTPFMVSFFMFMTYVLISPDHVLSPDIVFVSISLLNILRMPMILLPMIIVTVVQAGVSLKRMNKFINAEELNPEAVERDTSEGDPVVIENGNFSWGHEEEDKPVLKEINLRIPEGSLVGVVGTVGAGKSSLCSAILGEMEKNSGRVNVSKSVAFVPQQAWIQNATLKSNILFSKKDSSSFYQKVIKACALKPDLEVLPDGDRTEIGEKVYTKFKMFIMNINEDIQNLGINLSGGQKQRVSLARAVYSNAEIYLLDDPLSAVDAHVGKHIFEHVIGSSGILRNKTRVLVTHGLSHLREMDEIIVLKNGEIAERGSFSYLISKEGDFQEFLLQYLTQKEREEEELEPEVLEEIKSELEKSMGGKSMQRQISELSRASDTKEERSGSRSGRDSIRRRRGSDISRSSIKAQRDLKGTSDKGKIIKEETAGIGRMSSKVYIYYAKSIGMLAAILTILFYATSQAFAVLGNILLSEWSDNPNGSAPKTRNSYLYVYASFGIGQALSVLLGYTILARAAINGSKYLHNAMLDNVVHSPMSFYDMTPIGRIVNRFSKDTDIIDILLPMNLRSFLICLMSVIATYIAVIYATPMFAVVIVPALILYSIIQNVYIKTSRQLKRIESVTRSPIYTHFGESVQGAITIRAYHREEEFILQSREKVDYNQLSYYPNLVSYRWLAVRLELIGNILTFFAALFTVINRKSISGGDVGLSISYALSVTQVLNYLVRLTSEVETSMVSVERIKEYTEIPQEAAWDIPSNKPPKSWPENGVVEFKDYSTRYRSGLDLVIKNISCLINSTEKLGIVGRTGAGKSSLTVALFRIIEPANGTVLIDGVDISKIGLHDLRARLTIIPQDPVLFSGTLRMNLDPLNRHSDDSIWNAFEHSHLKEFVSSLPSKLNYGIAEGGENLSVGQRQLVCLARALLRKTKVLILDEATAAVDLETDDLIQETIRREFADCTVITIAHRLNTIMDSTRIIVLDRGEVKEFDTPSNLLQNPSSLFYDMSKSAGLI